jgi:predicted TPR repeat methyltransferase
MFAFSTELLQEAQQSQQSQQHSQEQPDFQLQPTGRFAHSERHVRTAAVASGWRVLILRSCVIRMNAGHPIVGSLAVLQHCS